MLELEPISLFDCANAIVSRGEISCLSGHRLARNGHVWAVRIQDKKDPLVFSDCQNCMDIDRYYDAPVEASDRGW
jgi:RNase P subunit RPR2